MQRLRQGIRELAIPVEAGAPSRGPPSEQAGQVQRRNMAVDGEGDRHPGVHEGLPCRQYTWRMARELPRQEPGELRPFVAGRAVVEGADLGAAVRRDRHEAGERVQLA